jgi:diguanylate cyclase (GGDEF)-like protein
LRQHLREQDVVARLDGTMFAFLLPDMPADGVVAMMERLQNRMAWTPFEVERSGIKLNLSSAAGVVAYQYDGTRQDEFLSQANRALQQAEAAGLGKVSLLSENEGRD